MPINRNTKSKLNGFNSYIEKNISENKISDITC